MAVCALLLLPAVPGSGVRCGRVCWGPGFGCAPPPLGKVLLGCACGRACAPLAPALLGGPPVARGCAGVAVGGVCPPPSPSFFFLALWCRSLPVPVLGLGVLVPQSLLFRAALYGVCVFSFSAWCVSACFGCPFSRWAAALGLVLPVLAGWSPGAPLGGPVFGAVWVGGLDASCGIGGRRDGCGPFSRPPPCWFFFGGVCLFLPLPSLGWRTHWSIFCVVFWFAVGDCVLPGRAPTPWVGWVMYTLGSVPLLAGLGSGSAGWAVVPGGFVWPWVSRVLSSLRAGFNFPPAAYMGGPPPLLPGVRWPFAGVWQAGAVPSGVCGGLFWLDPRSPSLAWCCGVLWCAVLRRVLF